MQDPATGGLVRVYVLPEDERARALASLPGGNPVTTSRTAQPEPPGSLLPLPNPAGLANTQRCGRSCLWCGVLPSLAAAVDLGQRRARDGTAWFPRACHTCARVRVNEALTAHRAFCQACIEVDDPCTTRDDLQALVGAR